jgi:hypothetical protein
MKLSEALKIANEVRGTNGCYQLPANRSVGEIAEAITLVSVALRRYRKEFSTFQTCISNVDAEVALPLEQ